MTTRLTKQIQRKLTSQHRLPNGISGTYIKLSKGKGVKLLHATCDTWEEALSVYKDALHEIRMMKAARKIYPFIPKCYGVKIFKFKGYIGYYKVGIILQHLGDTTLRSTLRKVRNSGSIIDDVAFHLEKQGFVHGDLHTSNIMVYRGKYWIIDFEAAHLIEKQSEIIEAA